MGCTTTKSPSAQTSIPQKYTYISNNLTHDEYDAQIVADSFYSLLIGKPWSIRIQSDDWRRYQRQVKLNTSQIAVLGYEKTGKSYLLSKLMNHPLPQGKNVRTSGLCILYPNSEAYPWIALDTPGTNISVKAEEVKREMAHYFRERNISQDEIMRMLFGDNIMMEALLQEFVIQHSQVILVVINKLRRDDQRLISRIKALPGKRVVIVHNLHECQDRATVDETIREDVFGAFNATQQVVQVNNITSKESNNVIYLEEDNDKKIQHIIMAHEGSPAGNFYNESAISYMRQVINAMNHNQPFDLIDSFVKYLNQHIRKYFSSREETEDPIRIRRDLTGVPTGLMLENNVHYDLKLSSANEFGDIQTYAREGLGEIPFTVKIINPTNEDSPQQKILQIEFEIVGACFNDDIFFKIEETGDHAKISIQGTSKNNTTLDGVTQQLYENTRKFGNFTISTDKIPIAGYTINRADKPRIAQDVPGLKSVSWNLYKLGHNIL